MFNCRICGKEYKNIEEVMNCEKECYKKKQREEREQKQKKLNQQKEARYIEVKKAFDEADNAYNKAVKLENKYKKDYSMITGNCISGDDLINELSHIFPRVF